MRAIYIDCGTSDDFNFIVDSRLVRDELQNLGIPHQYEEFSGNHLCCFMNSTGNALEVFSKAMSFDVLTGVEPRGKLAAAWGEIKYKK
jgi:S-formylglutathione hydrolase FrmB